MFFFPIGQFVKARCFSRKTSTNTTTENILKTEHFETADVTIILYDFSGSDAFCNFVRISVDRKIFIRFWPKPVKKRCVFKFIRMSVAENLRHGTAMSSPVSVTVAEIVVQNIEEQALATYRRNIPLWHIHSPPYTKTESTIFTNTLTDRTRTYSSPRRSKKMVR